MTFPVWIPIGSLRFHPHFAFEVLAMLTGIALYQAARETRGDHISTAHRWSLFAAIAVGGIIGSRLLNWLEDPSTPIRQWRDAVALIGGQTIVGGLLGAWIAVELQKRRLGITSSTGDLVAVPAAGAMAVGRIGCFLTGLSDGTYGVATSLPWGIDFGDGVLRHPTALYESAFLTVLAFALWRLHRRLPRGATFVIFAASYLLFRLCVDAIKPGVSVAFGLTAIQWACIAGLSYYALRYARASRAGHTATS